MSVRSDPREWSDARHRRGLRGEQLALQHLVRCGWEILDHRYRLGRLEIDVIARRDRVVAFIEVKTRRSDQFGTPFEAVTWGKQREIVRVARAWMRHHPDPEADFRFDVVGVTLTADGPHIEHVPDAFRSGWR